MKKTSKSKSVDKILEYLDSRQEARVIELVQLLEISPQAVHKNLKALLSAGKIQKHGSAPKVTYRLNKTANFKTMNQISQGQNIHVVKNFNQLAGQITNEYTDLIN